VGCPTFTWFLTSIWSDALPNYSWQTFIRLYHTFWKKNHHLPNFQNTHFYDFSMKHHFWVKFAAWLSPKHWIKAQTIMQIPCPINIVQKMTKKTLLLKLPICLNSECPCQYDVYVEYMHRDPLLLVCLIPGMLERSDHRGRMYWQPPLTKEQASSRSLCGFGGGICS